MAIAAVWLSLLLGVAVGRFFCLVPMSDSKLTNKQLAFVAAYLHGDEEGNGRFNATKAAIAVGYSPKTAAARGSEMRNDPQVSARIAEELDNRFLSGDAVLSELAEVATAPWREFLIIRTNPKTGETVEVKMDLSAKIKALELYGKHQQLFTDKLHLSGEITFAELAALADETDADAGAVDSATVSS